MGRLNVAYTIDLAQSSSVSAISIVHTPDNVLEKMYAIKGSLVKCNAATPPLNNYANTNWSNAAPLNYSKVTDCTIKSFPHYGSYGYATSTDGTKISTIFKKL